MALWRMEVVLSKTWISKYDQEGIFKVRREHGPTYDTRSSSGAWQLDRLDQPEGVFSLCQNLSSLCPSFEGQNYTKTVQSLCAPAALAFPSHGLRAAGELSRLHVQDHRLWSGSWMTTFCRGDIIFSLLPNSNGSMLGGPLWGQLNSCRESCRAPLGLSCGMWELSRLPRAWDPATTGHPSAHRPMCDYNDFHHLHPSLSCVYNHHRYSRVTEQKHPMQIRDARVSNELVTPFPSKEN